MRRCVSRVETAEKVAVGQERVSWSVGVQERGTGSKYRALSKGSADAMVAGSRRRKFWSWSLDRQRSWRG